MSYKGDPPANVSPEATRLRVAALKFCSSRHPEDHLASGGTDPTKRALNRRLLQAAIKYAEAARYQAKEELARRYFAEKRIKKGLTLKKGAQA
jgi:hypothetical protein